MIYTTVWIITMKSSRRFLLKTRPLRNRAKHYQLGKKSAGILVFRIRNKKPEIFLMHPGGPYWAKKDLGAWSIPKGEIEENEDESEAAIREFEEETGIQLNGELIPLKPIKQKSGKSVVAW